MKEEGNSSRHENCVLNQFYDKSPFESEFGVECFKGGCMHAFIS